MTLHFSASVIGAESWAKLSKELEEVRKNYKEMSAGMLSNKTPTYQGHSSLTLTITMHTHMRTQTSNDQRPRRYRESVYPFAPVK